MSDPTPDPIDWSQTTHEGNRRRQHLEFLALPLREKILRIEQMCEVAAHFDRLRKDRLRKDSAGPESDEPRRHEGHEENT